MIAVRIATRSSALALWQARHVAGLIRTAEPFAEVDLVEVSTHGDRDQTGALAEFGGQGVFTREVQRAVLDGRADLAVHSLKDLPTEPVEGLTLAGVPERASTDDALVLPKDATGECTLCSLPTNAKIGTGSLRRRAQLLHQRSDLQMLDVRGNVETRLRKLDAGEYDALVLAEAGLVRLGLQSRISALLSPPVMFPAVGQGALGIDCRTDDVHLRSLLERITHPPTLAAVTTERALLAELRAGCHAPLGARVEWTGNEFTLTAVLLSPDGRRRIEATQSGSADDAATAGRQAAKALLLNGADDLLRVSDRA